MHVHLPFYDRLPDGATVLVAGMGGGFDVFCGLPLYFELRRRGHAVHLASLSFAPLEEYRDCEWHSPTLVRADPAPAELSGYHPERYLSRWFQDCRGETVPVWCFQPTGPLTLAADYRLLVQRLGIDAIVLVDGGVDSLTRGDEALAGTVLEDYASLVAVALLDEVPARLMACVGMGVEGDVSHACVLENVAALCALGGFLGTSALPAQSEACQQYAEAVAYVHAQPGQQPSVINASILSAAEGRFGDYHATERTRGSELWISPLMSLYWCFMVEAVAARNLFLAALQQARTMGEMFDAIYPASDQMPLRPAKPLPFA